MEAKWEGFFLIICSFSLLFHSYLKFLAEKFLAPSFSQFAYITFAISTKANLLRYFLLQNID